MNENIVTPRLVLGVIKSEDRDALVEIFKNDAVKATYMLPDLNDEKSETKLFERIRALSESEETFVRGIFLENSIIGIINETERIGKTVELGYAIHPRYHSKGYATEALGAAIEYLFCKGSDTIVAGAFEENIASIRVMQKCGMKKADKVDEIDYREKTHRCVYYTIEQKQ